MPAGSGTTVTDRLPDAVSYVQLRVSLPDTVTAVNVPGLRPLANVEPLVNASPNEEPYESLRFGASTKFHV